MSNSRTQTIPSLYSSNPYFNLYSLLEPSYPPNLVKSNSPTTNLLHRSNIACIVKEKEKQTFIHTSKMNKTIQIKEWKGKKTRIFASQDQFSIYMEKHKLIALELEQKDDVKSPVFVKTFGELTHDSTYTQIVRSTMHMPISVDPPTMQHLTDIGNNLLSNTARQLMETHSTIINRTMERHAEITDRALLTFSRSVTEVSNSVKNSCDNAMKLLIFLILIVVALVIILTFVYLLILKEYAIAGVFVICIFGCGVAFVFVIKKKVKLE